MTTSVKEQKVFGESRLVIDLFGPILDISRIDAFEGTNPRYKTEEDIARHPDLKRRRDKKRWTGKLVIEETMHHLRDPRLGRRLVDKGMCDLLAVAAKWMDVAIVSSVPRVDVFEQGRDLVMSHLKAVNNCSSITEDSFHHLPSQGTRAASNRGICRYLLEKTYDGYTVVVDDGAPLSFDKDDVQLYRDCAQWISGEATEARLLKDVDDACARRRRIGDTLAFLQDEVGDELKLSTFEAVPGFYVFDKDTKASLSGELDSIAEMLQKETKGPPVCVFLGGPPGSGKSYFVKKYAKKLGAKGEAVTVSLSGVGAPQFASAIAKHVDDVYKKAADDESPLLACLDEMDTVMQTREMAFRLLMNAMTGSPTDKLGSAVERGGKDERNRIVWFFAGSAGRSSDDFVSEFTGYDRKVKDFFDRIHFHVELPSVENAGQAILQGVASLRKYDEAEEIQRVDRSVLLLFGAMPWRSARELDTACRVAMAASRGREEVALEAFQRVMDRKDSRDIYKNIVEEGIYKDDWVTIRWT